MEGFFRNCYYLSQTLSNSAPKLVFLQEIWVPHHQESLLNTKYPSYSAQISTPDQFISPEDRLSAPDHTWHGVAILWHDIIASSVLHLLNTNPRFTDIKVKFQGLSILAISLYLPTTGVEMKISQNVWLNYLTISEKMVERLELP